MNICTFCNLTNIQLFTIYTFNTGYTVDCYGNAESLKKKKKERITNGFRNTGKTLYADVTVF